MTSETISIIVTGILLGVGAWIKTNQDKQHLESKIAANTEITQSTAQSSNDLLDALQEAKALRQQLTTVTLQRDELRKDRDRMSDQLAFVKRDIAGAALLAQFSDKRRTHPAK